jgi:capsular polysaccharide biosynthesis protein
MNAKKAQIVAMAVAGGLALGILISVGLHLLDSSLRRSEQAERVTGISRRWRDTESSQI